MKTKFLLLVLLYTQFCTSQDGILLNTPDATNGYSLFSTSGSTYLVDNCGEIVKTWPVYSPTRHCKLLPDGNLIYMTSSTITELNWNNQVVNSVQLNELGLVLEYEVVKLKNDIQNLILELMENNIDIRAYDSYKKLSLSLDRLDNILMK